MTVTVSQGPALSLVVNPSSGQGRARRHLSAVCATLLSGLPGASLRVFQSRDIDDARARCHEVVAQANVERGDALIVMGGDGMMHLGVNACATTGVPLGVIPSGTGNDFARSIGIPMSPEEAARVIIAGHTRRMDLLQVSGRLASGRPSEYVAGIVSTGFDAMVNKRANETTWPKGRMRYARALFGVMGVFEPLSYRVRIDGHARHLRSILIAVGNTAYFGGGIKMLPNALVDDGELDVTIIHPASRATLLRVFPQLYRGTFISDPCVEMLRATTVEIDGDGLVGMADGEALGDPPLRIQVAPRVLDVFVPERS